MPLYRIGAEVTTLAYIDIEFDNDEQAEQYFEGEIGDLEGDFLDAGDHYEVLEVDGNALFRQDSSGDEDWIEI